MDVSGYFDCAEIVKWLSTVQLTIHDGLRGIPSKLANVKSDLMSGQLELTSLSGNGMAALAFSLASYTLLMWYWCRYTYGGFRGVYSKRYEAMGRQIAELRESIVGGAERYASVVEILAHEKWANFQMNNGARQSTRPVQTGAGGGGDGVPLELGQSSARHFTPESGHSDTQELEQLRSVIIFI